MCEYNKRDVCNFCKTDYYFIENQRNKCFYKINLESFYKEGGNVKDTFQESIANDRKKYELEKI